MPRLGRLYEWRSKLESWRFWNGYARRDKSERGSHCSRSSFFISAPMEAKNRHTASAEAIAVISAWRSPKETMSSTEYCMRSRSAAHCALSNSTFAERISEIRRAIPACFVGSSFNICNPSVKSFRRVDKLYGVTYTASKSKRSGPAVILGSAWRRALAQTSRSSTRTADTGRSLPVVVSGWRKGADHARRGQGCRHHYSHGI